MTENEKLTQGELFAGENLLPPAKEREVQIRDLARNLNRGRRPGPRVLRLAEEVIDSGVLDGEIGGLPESSEENV